jgi:hypothetical protein
MQIKLVAEAPIRASLISIEDLNFTILGKIDKIRTIPYPPSFRRMAAKTMEPAMGAST